MNRDFGTIGFEIMTILRKERKITDVMLMMRLNFTPETWRHWRAKFIELFEEITYTKIDSDDEERITYHKKQKLWTIQDV